MFIFDVNIDWMLTAFQFRSIRVNPDTCVKDITYPLAVMTRYSDRRCKPENVYSFHCQTRYIIMGYRLASISNCCDVTRNSEMRSFKPITILSSVS